MDKPTIEQIDSQPAGRFMDKWLAKYVMGLEIFEFWRDAFKKFGDKFGYVPLIKINYEGSLKYHRDGLISLWEPSTDIASAYQVVDKMIGVGYGISINHEPTGTGWDVVFWPPSDERGISADYAFRCAGIADTNSLPLAIGRAALKTVCLDTTFGKGDKK